jgi:hypothetical protein
MAFTYIRHQLHLHRQKAIVSALFILCLFGATQAQAQKKIKGENKPGYDEKRVHYGFYLGMPLTKYQVEHSQAYVNQLPAIKINAKNSPGFYTGLVLNVRLFQYLDARFVPGVGFYGRTIEFDGIDPNDGSAGPVFDDITISSTMVELPFLLKYRAKRRGNARMYFVGGVKPSIDLGNLKDTSSGGTKLHSEKYDLALEYGVGLDIFYPYFKFAPELRFSHGLLNQKKSSFSSPHSDLIDKMTNHNVSFILFFE